MVLLKNSKRDLKKGDKMMNKWLGPYQIAKAKEKGNYQLLNPSTNVILAKTINASRLKKYHQPPDEPEPPSKRRKKADTPLKREKKRNKQVQVSCGLCLYMYLIMFHHFIFSPI